VVLLVHDDDAAGVNSLYVMMRATGDVIVIASRSSPRLASMRRSSRSCCARKVVMTAGSMWLLEG
jgi:hypothetical protein